MKNNIKTSELREQLWHEVFGRSSTEGGEGLSPEQHCLFVRRVAELPLERLRHVFGDKKGFVPDLWCSVDHCADQVNELFLSAAQRALAAMAKATEQDSVAEMVLQGVLLMTAVSIEEDAAHHDFWKSTRKRLAEASIIPLQAERDGLLAGRETEWLWIQRLASILGASITALPSGVRLRFIKLIDDIATVAPAIYADPFLQDRVIIYKNMNMDRLEELYGLSEDD